MTGLTEARCLRRRASALLVVVLVASSAAANEPSVLDAAFDETLQRYKPQGLAVGIVQDGKVVYLRTAGELVAGEGRPVDADTLFKIASNTKSMTTATLARLVDAGKLRWDDPVIKHLPQFRMHDPWVTREMQVRDLLIHNSGLRAGAGDLMLWPEPNAFDRGDVIRGLRHLKPIHSFRSHYDYDNLLYIVAGEVAAAAGGATYETLVRREVFEPLGMTRCQVGAWNRDRVGNVAQPHTRQGTRNVPFRRDGVNIPRTTMDAAGGIRCSLKDMLTWVQAWLEPDERWISTEQRAALWSAHTPMPVTARQRAWNDTQFSAYGYGWRLIDVAGEFNVAHTGSLAGMYSYVTLVPGKKVGFVILTSGDGDEARVVLNQVLLRHFTSPRPHATTAYYADFLAREASDTPASAKAPNTSTRRRVPASDISAALGVYRDAWFGEVSVCPDGDGVRFVSSKSPRLDGMIMGVGERLLIDWSDATVDAEAWVTFAPARGSGPARMTMAKVDPGADFSFDFEDLAFERLRDCDEARAAQGE